MLLESDQICTLLIFEWSKQEQGAIAYKIFLNG